MAFDALGRKIVENAGTAHDLYFSQSWQILQEDWSGSAKIQNVWSPAGIDTYVERDRDADGSSANGLEERLYVEQDANANVTALVDTSGTVQERYQYDPYGAVTILTAAWGARASSSYAFTNFFQGARYDSTTGLFNFRNREYSLTLGRWIQNDPLDYAAGDNNTYRALGNAPAGTRDALGLRAEMAMDEENSLQPSSNAQSSDERPHSPFGPAFGAPMMAPAIPPRDFHAIPKPGKKIVYSGSQAMEALGFKKYNSTWSLLDWSTTSQYDLFKMGCVGLNMLRLNTKSQITLPGTRAYVKLEDALAAQKELAANSPKDKLIVLWALQSVAPQSDMAQFLKPGSTTEYMVPEVGAARTLPGKVLTCYDFATAFQTPDGQIMFWEVMPFGESGNSGLDVYHKTDLYEEAGTAYFVVSIDNHKLAPLSPSGSK